MRSLALLLLLLASAAGAPSVSTAQSPPLATEQLNSAYPQSTIRRPPTGPYAIGFRTGELHDASRGYGAPFDSEGNPAVIRAERPIAVSIWYPAAEAAGQPMRLVDYLSFETEPGVFPASTDERAAMVRAMLEDPAPAPHLAREREAAVHARIDAPAASGRFPLVVYAPGAGAPAIDNFYLHEWLASHGYIVVGINSWGPVAEMTADAAGLETQVRDMEYALGWARSLPNVDATKVAFVGFSWGGMANIMAAVRNPAVSAVVSLDGSIHFYAEQMKDFPFFHPDRLTVPSLFLSSLRLTPERRAAGGNSFYDKLHFSDATHVVFPQLGHMNFTSVAPLLAPPNPTFKTDTLIVGRTLEHMARYTTAFLDAVLKDDERGRAFLAQTPEANGIPDGDALVERRPALRPLPTAAAFAAEVRRQGRTLADAASVVESIRSANPTWTLDESEVNKWGYRLLEQDRHAEAIGVFELNTRLHPDEPNTYDSLGEGYVTAGRLTEALASYRKALELGTARGDVRVATFRANIERTEQRIRELRR